ncbi:MAG: glycosyltransferase [Lachnoclostridium sp.]|jgi:glycosyltransferase involved in cell wall biosynthesis
MKLLIVTTTVFELDGITNTVMNYYLNLDKTNLQIDFAVPNKVTDRLKKPITENGGTVYELAGRKKNPFLYWRKLREIIRSNRYDMIHAHGNSATLLLEMSAAKMAGTKIRIAHCHNTSCSHPVINRLLKPVFYKMYTHGFACGLDAGKWLFGDRKFTVLKNGTEIEKYVFQSRVREEYRRKFNLTGRKVIGHVGNFVPQKNHEFIIYTFYELIISNPDCVLILVGDGPLLNKMKQMAMELGIYNKIIFMGKSFEVPYLLQAMDVMILPSLFEGFPNVVVEWQIAGLPCIVSDTVTSQVKLTDLVEFLPLSLGPKAWAERLNKIELSDREKTREKVMKEVREAGFDIRTNAIELRNLYFDFVKR